MQEQGEVDLVKRIRAYLPAADALIISDYGKGTITKFVAAESIKAARDAEIPSSSTPTACTTAVTRAPP